MAFSVAPLVGAWIEIITEHPVETGYNVAPLVGAWIEIQYFRRYDEEEAKSHPLWVRGLKYLSSLVLYA